VFSVVKVVICVRISKRREDPKQKDQIRLMFSSLRVVVDDRTIQQEREREGKGEKGMFNVDNRLNRKKKSSPLSLPVVSEKRNK
jgi:hypothetical protein